MSFAVTMSVSLHPTTVMLCESCPTVLASAPSRRPNPWTKPRPNQASRSLSRLCILDDQGFVVCSHHLHETLDFVAVEPSERTRGECCRDPAPRLLDLAGECLDGIKINNDISAVELVMTLLYESR